MHVYLLRHGQAADLSPDGPRTDEERPLTEEGRALFVRACKHYRRHMEPLDGILSSPLVRARQTAGVLAGALDPSPEIEGERDLLPGARPAAILDRLQADLLEGKRALALVGHEPQLGNLLGLLLTGSEQTAIPLKKGMIAGVRLAEPQTMIGRLVLCLGQDVAAELA